MAKPAFCPGLANLVAAVTDRQHPLSNGLLAAYFPGVNLGVELAASVPANTITPVGFDSTAFGPATNNLYSSPTNFIRPEYDFTGDFSFFFAGKIPAVGSISPMIYFSTTGGSIKAYLWQNTGASLIFGYQDTGGSFRDFVSTISIASNQSITCGASAAVGGGAWFTQINGVQANSGTTTGTPRSFSNTAFMPWCGPNSGLPGNSIGSVGLAWTRALSADELALAHGIASDYSAAIDKRRAVFAVAAAASVGIWKLAGARSRLAGRGGLAA